MELLSRDRTICGGAAQRVRNRRLSKPNTVVIRRAGYGALGRLDQVRGVRFLRLTRRAADGPVQPEMTRSRLSPKAKSRGSSWVERRSASGLLDDGFAPIPAVRGTKVEPIGPAVSGHSPVRHR